MNEAECRQQLIAAADITYERFKDDGYPMESPLKYVGHARVETLDRVFRLARLMRLSAASRVLEFGPGAGFLMYALREVYGCQVEGVDVPDRPVYKFVQNLLGLHVHDETISPGRWPSVVTGDYDQIVASQACWLMPWSLLEFWAFARTCMDHIVPGGQMWLSMPPYPPGEYLVFRQFT